jgi:sialate O-acetylesterase
MKLSLGLFFGLLASGQAEVRLPSIFSDHAVLQRSAAVPIWGKAGAGEEVNIGVGAVKGHTTAGADGKWRIALDLKDAGPGPFDLTINQLTIHDVLVGQAWFLIGQSNAERLLKETADAPAEATRSTNSLVREFRIAKKGFDTPQDDAKGSWVLAEPKTTPEFSAIGYYFAKKLQAEIGQPVGIINGSWGGTFIEAWMSEQAIDGDPALRAGETARRKEMAEFGPLRAKYVNDFGAWLEANGREDRPCPDPSAFAGPNVDTSGWGAVTLPGKVEAAGLPGNGAIWIRREVEVPAALEGLVVKLSLGQMTAFEETWWNGKKIFELPYQKLPGANYTHYFVIPQSELRPGKAVLAIRLYAPVEVPALIAAPERLTAGPLPLRGEWRARAEYSLPELSPEVAAAAPRPPRQPPSLKAAAIFNGVVNPVIPYGIAGILWYQGESNAGTAYQYRTTFPLFIEDLRAKWGRPELPFYFCQLANYMPKRDRPMESAWAELRESQARALALPATAQAVLIDLGEAADIHPRDKVDVGGRLARIALARQYGRIGIVWAGPSFENVAVEGEKMRVTFKEVAGGLVAKPLPARYPVSTLLHQDAPLVRNSPGSEVEGFAICGADRKWVWADAKIEGASVLVWSAQVPAPVAVRYAWADNPTCNLYNSAGLPASPFRTDDFQVSTEPYRFGLSQQGRY